MSAPIQQPSKFDFLLNHSETPTRVQRQRVARGTWHQIHPPTLVKQFNDPHIAIAAAVIQLALLDIKKNSNKQNAMQFIQSDWFGTIARSLSYDQAKLRTAIAQLN